MTDKFYFALSIFLFATFPLITVGQDPIYNVDVVVENKRGELLLGLTKGNFQVRVNGKMVEGADVVDSSDELAAGLLLDISTSMFSEGVQRTDRIGWAKGAMLSLLDGLPSGSESFVLTFGERIVLISDFDGADSVSQRIRESGDLFQRQKGITRLNDAITAAIGKLERSEKRRRILFIATDGMDYGSIYQNNELKSQIRGASVQLYFLVLPEKVPPGTLQEWYARTRSEPLVELAKDSGGRVFLGDDLKRANSVGKGLATILQNQYTLKVPLKLLNRTGKWHSLDVRVDLPRAEAKRAGVLTVHHKRGFFPLSTLSLADRK